MDRAQVRFNLGFQVLAGNARSQAAALVLAAGESTGGPDNRHSQSDQWLYVASGGAVVVIDGREHPLTAGSLILIEHGETHEIRNTGDTPLEALSFYAPPAYDERGERLREGGRG